MIISKKGKDVIVDFEGRRPYHDIRIKGKNVTIRGAMFMCEGYRMPFWKKVVACYEIWDWLTHSRISKEQADEIIRLQERQRLIDGTK